MFDYGHTPNTVSHTLQPPKKLPHGIVQMHLKRKWKSTKKKGRKKSRGEATLTGRIKF